MTWDRATLALTLLAIDPNGLGGIVVRARTGPVRDTFIEALHVLPQPLLKLHPAIDDESLFGGIDLTETLTHGVLKTRPGLIDRDGTALLTMAERCDVTLAARLAMALDDNSLHSCVALDEGAEPDECVPATLSERFAFHIDLDMSIHDVALLPDPAEVETAKAHLGNVTVPENTFETVVSICAQFGVNSQRGPLFTIRAARAHAALRGRETIVETDIEVAAALCLAHRATNNPSVSDQSEAESGRPESANPDQGDDSSTADIQTLDDRVLDAILAELPDGLLDQIKPKRLGGAGSGAGAISKSNRRGRPKPSRSGGLSGHNRLDLIATLRTAAPWQTLRGREKGRLKVTPSDFRIKQYEKKSDRLLIFAVDASGSAAIARLAEAKGAVELLLADAYSRRDQVCLISFRGEIAETLLPPTRSLVQTKKRLAALPGGGGTPLAAGLFEGLQTAMVARSRGMTPCIIVLTDGRANIALNGTPDRIAAGSDAEAVARQIRATGTDAIVLDLGNRPAKFLADLAVEMDAHYAPLPRADARKVSNAISAVLEV